MKHKTLAILLVLSLGILLYTATSWASNIITFYFSDTDITSGMALGALPSGDNSVVQQYRMSSNSVDDLTFTDLLTGAIGTVSARNDGFKTNGYTDAPALLQDYGSSSRNIANISKITFTGLKPNADYTFYVYSQGFNDSSHNFITNIDVNATGSFQRLGTLTTTDLSSYAVGQNYLVDTVTTGANGKLVLSFYTDAGNSINRGALNAVQLVYGNPTPIPEPASIALFSTGGCLLLALRSRKKFRAARQL